MTEGERNLCEWQFGLSKGSFFGFLFEALGHADSINTARIGAGFPEEAMAYHRFANESDYWETLQKKWKENA